MDIRAIHIGDEVVERGYTDVYRVIALGCRNDTDVHVVDADTGEDPQMFDVSELELADLRYKLPEWEFDGDARMYVSRTPSIMLDIEHRIQEEGEEWRLYVVRGDEVVFTCKCKTLEAAQEKAVKGFNQMMEEIIKKITK